MSLSTPTKVSVPFAQSGLKDAIPASADNVNGRAGYDQGFPPINMTPRTAGGIPPFGQDMNGILYDVTLALQYLEAGGQFPYDAAFATAIGGYPNGAVVSRSDLQGVWRNTVNGNTSDPETGGTGWQPEGSGATSVTMASSNVTLSAIEAARSIIIIHGTLTANLQLIFPAYVKQWLVVNTASGAFSVTCKTASGSGVSIDTGKSAPIYGDGTNIAGSLGLGNAAYATVMSSLTDNTAGRLQPVGAFGNGGDVIEVSSGTALDATRPSGRYHFQVSVAGLPVAGAGLTATIKRRVTGDVEIFGTSNNLSAMGPYYNRYDPAPGTWTGWQKVFSANNVSAFIQTLFDDSDALTARTTLGACGITSPSTLSLSGTAVDFTGVPSWAKRVRIGINNASVNATTAIQVQLGTSGGIVTSGYTGAVGVFQNGNSGVNALSSGVQINLISAIASALTSGIVEFEYMGSNVWAFKSTAGSTLPDIASTGGVITLPGALTTIRLTTNNGTAAFDSGVASIIYEG